MLPCPCCPKPLPILERLGLWRGKWFERWQSQTSQYIGPCGIILEWNEANLPPIVRLYCSHDLVQVSLLAVIGWGSHLNWSPFQLLFIRWCLRHWHDCISRVEHCLAWGSTDCRGTWQPGADCGRPKGFKELSVIGKYLCVLISTL